MGSETTLDIVVRAKDEASRTFNSMKSNLKGLSVAMGIAGGAIVAGLGLTVKAAMSAQVEIARMDATLATMGEAGLKARDGILQAAAASAKLGFDDEEAAVSVTKFFQRTNDLTKATELNALAMDLARAKNIDLSTAATLVNQVLSGNGKVLEQYDIDLKESASPLEALGELHKKVAGQAEAFSLTTAGAMDVWKVSMGNLQEAIGEKLLPQLANLVQYIAPVIEKLTALIEEHPKLVAGIVLAVAAIGVFLTVLGTLGIVVPAVISGLSLLASLGPIIGAAFTLMLGPVGLVIIAIAAVTAGLIWLWKNSDIVNAALIAGWEAVKEAYTSISEGIKSAVGAAFNWIIGKANSVISTINSVISMANKIPGVNLGSIGAIPAMAAGGIVTSPTLAMIGEAGPEAVIPLSRAGAGVGGTSVNISIGNFWGGNPEMAAREIGDLIIRRLQANARI